MLRDFKFLRRNSGKNPHSEEAENLPVNPKDDTLNPHMNNDPSRPPLSAIQDMSRIPRGISDQELSSFKPNKHSDTPPFHTPEKQGLMSKKRFNWAQKRETNSVMDTPGSSRAVERADLSYSECNSTQSTPTKSVNKPPNQGFSLASGSRPMVNASARLANYAALSKGISSCNNSTVVNNVEVPYFELKEDPSFWMEHNVQVLIRVRPLNSMEKSSFGFSRCLKQETAQSITWIGQPETRFMFDHVACEAIDQETLFRMVGLPMVENCLSGYNSCMFAYGQTGSGKTYTMLGEIEGLEVKPSQSRGMTPRIFEFLFARIRAEEEIRRDEKLKYNCKCSFLEIYNEQITDLLDPSSTNLMLREDMKNGVYVENLSEFEVHTVGDILHLLTQGSANRRVAATNMNRESSRSHSVFTCVIESRWQKDSNANFRFARLNLVDLAGSERQKSSGAEGERLKEAANINKSLSTLGHVIMVLVDVAHGRPRHIPYRDSRLTFLLQDSLGGNSKTMIIANVSPSICSVSETLNTLKFAQRAKLIQNNAIINEDSSGDVIALKRQIQLLKEELFILKREKVNRSLPFGETIDDDYNNMTGKESHGVLRVSCKQLKSLECTLAGAIRREQMAETSIKKLEAEIEQLNRLVSQREEDTRCTKMMLKFREDKIQRMESLLCGSMLTDDYLLKENHALSEENQLLRARLDKNPEVTRFALENIRLLEQVRRFQDLYGEGEREMLMTEVSELRNQLICSFDGNSKHPNHLDKKVSDHGDNEKDLLNKELKRTLSELDESKTKLNCCLEENAKLRGEIEKLHASLEAVTSATQEHDCSAEVIKESIVEVPLFSHQSIRTTKEENDQERCENLMKHAENIMDLQLELDILKIILQEERSYLAEKEEMVKSVNGELQLSKEMVLSVTKEYEKAHEELEKAKLVIEALESQQILSINEIEDLRNNNVRYEQLLNVKELEISSLKEKADCQAFNDMSYKRPESEDSPLEAKLKKMHESLEKAKKLNKWYQSDLAFQESNEKEMEEARKQVEAETAEVIVCLQEELSVLQQEVQESKTKETETRDRLALLQTEMKNMEDNLLLTSEDNAKLAEMLDDKEKQLAMLMEECDLIGGEIEGILSGGHEALKDVSDQIEIISSSIPLERSSISEKIETLKKYIYEKELLVEELNRCLEGAVDRKNDMECMLRSLRGAALIMTETHQQECIEKDRKIQLLTSDLNDKSITVEELQRLIEHGESQLVKASSCATAALVIVNRLWELNSNYQGGLNDKDVKIREFQEIIDQKDTILHNQASIIDEADKKNWQAVQVEMKENEIFEAKEKIRELNSEVSALKSCMNDYVSQGGNPQKDKADECQLWTGTRIEEDINNVDLCNAAKECKTNDSKLVCESIQKSENGRDATTITLLKTEIESALKSLKEVQAEMAKLRCEKEDIVASEKCNGKSIESLISQAVILQDAIDSFEGEFEHKVDVLDCKIRKMEEIVLEFSTSWLQQRELLEAELNDAKVVATQKSIEASCIFEKFEEVQDTVKEADIMINELMIANEALKLKAYDRKLALLMKELDFTNKQSLASIQDQERLLKEKDELVQNQEENFMIELSAKDFELLILSTELKQMFLLKNELEKTCISTLDNFKKDIVFKSLDAAFGELILLDKESQYEKLLEDFKTKETALDVENQRLRNSYSALEDCVAKLEEDLSLARMEIKNHELSQLGNANALKEENVFLINELRVHEISKSEHLNAIYLKSLKNVDLAENVDRVNCKIHNLISEKFVEMDDKFEKIVNEMEKPYKFVEQFEHLENLAMQLNSGFVSLQMEMSRKDDILKGLLFDLSFLQESASNSQDQKDEKERVMNILRELEEDFDVKSTELDEAVAEGRILKAQLLENMGKLSDLELDIAKSHEIINSLSREKGELLAALEAKNPVEKELIETRMKNENLEMEIAEMEMVITRMSKTTETLKDKLDDVTCQRDEMDDIVLSLTKELEMARALAEENEAIAIETREMAELCKVNAEEKEEEVKLLERSIEELECTINVLEQKVDIIKGEAEMQRLQREELQLELLVVKEQMQNVESNDSEIKRYLDEKDKKLLEARQRVELLEKEIASRDYEISQCKAHICELNLHAEAQARDNKQKLKALEAMVEQVKSEVPATHIPSSSSNKLERNASKPRGSGSPFKCIGLGLQIKSERDEELSAGRQRIEELEGLLVGRQKEIFMLNARLAATESMTHDVIRDLLGVKLNMNNYASLMDNQKLHSLMEEAQHHNADAQVKEQEVVNLKQQINDFVKERNGWLEEIERKQTELMATHVALEKLRLQDQLLAAENEMLKMANSNNKRRVVELEDEVKKLSGQQNIQQRIHHHAKIKEENNSLRCQNEELCIKLRKTEAILSRVKDELAQFRAANGRNPYINFDKEQQLDMKLQETEEERLQLAQKLLGLCTNVLKAAGIRRPTSEISVSVAEEALKQLKNRVVSLEMELQDVKLKNRISDERVRLSELRPQTSTSDENSHRVSQTTPFLSAFDR